MLLAKDSTVKRISLFIKLQFLSIIADFSVRIGKIAQGGECVGMLLAKDFAAKQISLFVKLPFLYIIADFSVRIGKII